VGGAVSDAVGKERESDHGHEKKKVKVVHVPTAAQLIEGRAEGRRKGILINLLYGKSLRLVRGAATRKGGEKQNSAVEKNESKGGNSARRTKNHVSGRSDGRALSSASRHGLGKGVLSTLGGREKAIAWKNFKKRPRP